MSRFFIWCGSVLLASIFLGGCYSASHHYQRSFPNMIGYTYPNWCGPPLVTPPNGPPDDEAYAHLMDEKTGGSTDNVSVAKPFDGTAPEARNPSVAAP
jgi:hypothetical protein